MTGDSRVSGTSEAGVGAWCEVKHTWSDNPSVWCLFVAPLVLLLKFAAGAFQKKTFIRKKA